MRWQKHSQFEGQHAFLSPSQNSWLNYDDDKLISSYHNHLATQRGTELHAMAAELISHRIFLPEDHTTLSMYVNDGISYGLRTEQVLYFSDNCFGTADAIRYYDEGGRPFLRIHDLKTGRVPAHIQQLYVYAALFFLEYDIPVAETDIECRIYQNNDIVIDNPTIEDIAPVIDKIITFDRILENIKRENEQWIDIR